MNAYPLHSQLEQRQRLKNLDRFKSFSNSVLLATDIASRGLDIPSVSHVIHYSPPLSADAYVHRVGRTARAGQKGFSLGLIAPAERGRWIGIMKAVGRGEDLAILSKVLVVDVRLRWRRRGHVGGPFSHS